jgi:RNA recognition motif-containing protein
MVQKLYISNLPGNTPEGDVRDLFAPYGQVHSVRLIVDRATGQLRGFGFVEMDEAAASSAIAALNGADFRGRELQVNDARERIPRAAGKAHPSERGSPSENSPDTPHPRRQ